MPHLKILIVGAGLGGLALAQSLRRAAIDFEIFERDGSPFDRAQGYRLHLDADAISAMGEVLAPDLHAVFEATAQRTQPFTTILGKDLSVIRRLPTHDEYGDVWPNGAGQDAHVNVDRATLRQILLAGLEDKLHYGKTLDRYEADGDGVKVYFLDGTMAQGDVLVGADGIRSPVRRQRAPDHDTVDAGITAIYGRVNIERASQLVPKEVMEDIFTVSTDDRKVFLGLGAVRFPMKPEQAVAKFAPNLVLTPKEDYVVCIVGGRHEFFPRNLNNASSDELQRVAVSTLETWPEEAAKVVRAGDPSAFFLVEMFTSVPFALDAPTNVTLLGDAIHAMTPTLGRGANLAMRDGVLLGRELKNAALGKSTVGEALATYERGMLEYGFSVVREAAKVGMQRMAQNPLPA